jgi:hypothetical protein
MVLFCVGDLFRKCCLKYVLWPGECRQPYVTVHEGGFQGTGNWEILEALRAEGEGGQPASRRQHAIT